MKNSPETASPGNLPPQEAERLKQQAQTFMRVADRLAGTVNGMLSALKAPKETMDDAECGDSEHLIWFAGQVCAKNAAMREAIENFLPFALEDYYPEEATDEYRKTVEDIHSCLNSPDAGAALLERLRVAEAEIVRLRAAGGIRTIPT